MSLRRFRIIPVNVIGIKIDKIRIKARIIFREFAQEFNTIITHKGCTRRNFSSKLGDDRSIDINTEESATIFSYIRIKQIS